MREGQAHPAVHCQLYLTEAGQKIIEIAGVPGKAAAVPSGDGTPSPVRARLEALDSRYRYSAAFTHATGLAPWDPEVARLYDVARALETRPEDAISMAVAHASISPGASARRAAHMVAVTAALAGVEHDAPPRRMTALAEYARQLRAALAALEQGTAAQDAELASAVSALAGRVAPEGTESIRKDLAAAAGVLRGGDRGSAWHHLDMARRAAAGEFGRDGMLAPLGDGTAAHEAIGDLLGRLAPAPPAAGTFSDLLHAGDITNTAGKVVTHDLHGGPDDPRALAVAG